MNLVNVHQAKTTLSKLLESVERGEEIVIARAGKPVARLVAYQSSSTPSKRPLGSWEDGNTSRSRSVPSSVSTPSIPDEEIEVQLL